MIISEAANRVLELMDLADEEEYDVNNAIIHVNQAIFELSEESEYSFMNAITGYELLSPEEGFEPDYWLSVPGRAPLTGVLATSWSEFGYIKKAWLSVDGGQIEFPQRSLVELLDEYGDDTGQPAKYAIDGEYLYWRPFNSPGETTSARFYWVKSPVELSAGSEPLLLSQVPYEVIYRACMIAAVWTQDDKRVPMLGQLSKDAFEKYNMRYTMNNDGPRSMEEFNG